MLRNRLLPDRNEKSYNNIEKREISSRIPPDTYVCSPTGELIEEIILKLCMKDEDGVVKGFPLWQFAYRRGHSVVNTVEWVEAKITQLRERGFTSVICALDISKAFDGVWHEGLIHKIRKITESGQITKMIQSFV